MNWQQRMLASALTTAGLFFLSAPAEAQHLVWPEVGAGVGTFTGANGSDLAAQFDFSIGWEREGYPWSPGFLARFDLIAIDEQQNGEFNNIHFDIAPLFTVSNTYDTVSPFFRAGAGPLVTFQENLVGVGAHGELAVGFKSIAELYLDARVSPDQVDGVELGVTAGLRLNSFIADRMGYWW